MDGCVRDQIGFTGGGGDKLIFLVKLFNHLIVFKMSTGILQNVNIIVKKFDINIARFFSLF